MKDKKTDAPLLRHIKKEAAKLAKERGIPHAEALEIVAERLGFIDYAEARRRASEGGTP